MNIKKLRIDELEEELKENIDKYEKMTNAYEDAINREGELCDEKNNLQAAMAELKENLS